MASSIKRCVVPLPATGRNKRPRTDRDDTSALAASDKYRDMAQRRWQTAAAGLARARAAETMTIDIVQLLENYARATGDTPRSEALVAAVRKKTEAARFVVQAATIEEQEAMQSRNAASEYYRLVKQQVASSNTEPTERRNEDSAAVVSAPSEAEAAPNASESPSANRTDAKAAPKALAEASNVAPSAAVPPKIQREIRRQLQALHDSSSDYSTEASLKRLNDILSEQPEGKHVFLSEGGSDSTLSLIDRYRKKHGCPPSRGKVLVYAGRLVLKYMIGQEKEIIKHFSHLYDAGAHFKLLHHHLGEDISTDECHGQGYIDIMQHLEDYMARSDYDVSSRVSYIVEAVNSRSPWKRGHEWACDVLQRISESDAGLAAIREVPLARVALEKHENDYARHDMDDLDCGILCHHKAQSVLDRLCD